LIGYIDLCDVAACGVFSHRSKKDHRASVTNEPTE
jgi:hypothetical protein